jgi:hypothetical protein
MIESNNKLEGEESPSNKVPNFDIMMTSVGAKLTQRAEANRYYNLCFKIIQSYLFLVFITISILGNTICLSMDSYPSNI